MACKAAGQKKKGSASLYEQYRPKKTKQTDSSRHMLRLRPCTYSEQNDAQMEDVGKKEQVGITWMDMAPFVDSPSKSRYDLADEISVPPETFDLDNLNEVLSYKVWTKCLTESDRKLLAQFLPSGIETEQVVQSLLTGENHHFGNPFYRWSTSVCSGKLDPNALFSKSRQLISNRRTYFSELNKYHTGMLDVLGRWKERWMSCKDPEKLLRKGPITYNQKRLPHSAPSAKGTFPNSTRRDEGSLPDSKRRDEESLPFSTRIVKAAHVSKRELPPIICIRHNGSTKHTSHIKINSKQYQLIKKLKPSGCGISFKSLCRVLGDINCFPVPKTSEDDEKKKMHELWAQLATKDIPAAFAYRRAKKLQREQWGKSLEQELAEKRKSIMNTDVETRNLESLPQEQASTRDSAQSTTDVLIPKDLHPYQILSYDAQQKLSSMISNKVEMEEVAQRAARPPLPFHFLGNTNPPEDSMKIVSSISSPEDLSQADKNHEFFYRSTTETQRHISTAEMSLNQHQPLTYSYGQYNLWQPQLQHFMANNSFAELGMHRMTKTNAFTSSSYPYQNSYDGALTGHNWFSGEGQACNGWSEVGPAVSRGQYLGSSGNSLDGSHYNIVSGCDMNSPYVVSYSEQFTQGTDYIRGVNPSDGFRRLVTHRPEMMRNFDPAGSNASLNGVSWMTTSNQNPGFTPNWNIGFPGSIGRASQNYRNQ